MEFSTGKGDQASEELSLVGVTRVEHSSSLPSVHDEIIPPTSSVPLG